jgi:hypothetical protein
MLTGAAEILNRADMYSRMALSIPELNLGFPDGALHKFDQIDDLKLAQVIKDASSPLILSSIRKFATIEGDYLNPNRKGLGRVSSESIPRLGALLYEEASQGNCDLQLLSAAVERSIHAGYISVIALTGAGKMPILRKDNEQIWDDWIPKAYSVPQDGSDLVFNNCGIDQFWSEVLKRGGFKKSHKDFLSAGRGYSEVANSIGNLCCTGVGLFSAERLP